MSQTRLAVAAAGAPTPTGLPEGAGEAQQYLVFSLCGETFAIGIRSIKEIIEYGHLTEVPMMPELVRGVINLRGAVVPVMDLAVRFGRAPTQIARRTCIVIVEIEAGAESGADETQVVGVIVDAVNEVLDIPIGDIEPPPSFGVRIRSDFIGGMGKVAGRFVILLNLKHVLSIDELAGIAETANGVEADATVPQELTFAS
ncbi:MAG: purine-binding chemotaxis protein CheW [Acetobacteraceae bacterium]|nr:purine-binding chemotaxis protein CheW [Acetobacteraceae bacterium]